MKLNTSSPLQVFPFKLRDHLVPFLFNEFKSEEEVLMPRVKTKSVKLDKMSSLCRMINMIHSIYEENAHVYDYRLQFSIKNVVGGRKYESALYKSHNNEHILLEFSQVHNWQINGFFEDIFRTAFVFYVNGSRQFTKESVISVINDFIDTYELLELGFDTEALRILYYRETGKTNKLSRFQHKMTNRVYNYE